MNNRIKIIALFVSYNFFTPAYAAVHLNNVSEYGMKAQNTSKIKGAPSKQHQTFNLPSPEHDSYTHKFNQAKEIFDVAMNKESEIKITLNAKKIKENHILNISKEIASLNQFHSPKALENLFKGLELSIDDFKRDGIKDQYLKPKMFKQKGVLKVKYKDNNQEISFTLTLSDAHGHQHKYPVSIEISPHSDRCSTTEDYSSELFSSTCSSSHHDWRHDSLSDEDVDLNRLSHDDDLISASDPLSSDFDEVPSLEKNADVGWSEGFGQMLDELGLKVSEETLEFLQSQNIQVKHGFNAKNKSTLKFTFDIAKVSEKDRHLLQRFAQEIKFDIEEDPSSYEVYGWGFTSDEFSMTKVGYHQNAHTIEDRDARGKKYRDPWTGKIVIKRGPLNPTLERMKNRLQQNKIVSLNVRFDELGTTSVTLRKREIHQFKTIEIQVINSDEHQEPELNLNKAGTSDWVVDFAATKNADSLDFYVSYLNFRPDAEIKVDLSEFSNYSIVPLHYYDQLKDELHKRSKSLDASTIDHLLFKQTSIYEPDQYSQYYKSDMRIMVTLGDLRKNSQLHDSSHLVSMRTGEAFLLIPSDKSLKPVRVTVHGHAVEKDHQKKYQTYGSKTYDKSYLDEMSNWCHRYLRVKWYETAQSTESGNQIAHYTKSFYQDSDFFER